MWIDEYEIYVVREELFGMLSLYVNEINFYVMLLYNLLPITNNCMICNV